MSDENQLRKSLLAQNGGEASHAPDLDEISSRETRRVRRWAVLTIGAWVVLGIYLVVNLLVLRTYFYPSLFSIAVDLDPEHWTQQRIGEVMHYLGQYLFYSNVVWPVLLVVAALTTTLFILKSRQATLRTIRTSLTQIAQQLQELPTRELG